MRDGRGLAWWLRTLSWGRLAGLVGLRAMKTVVRTEGGLEE